ncbi:MAG: helix-turn-helix domain-containing protein, partial [Oscillospiraceae bacterium]|nr:helix-turn-helix domain-containing protein [Oscillospiraceae bacterium]
MSVSDVAVAVGFQDFAYFSRLFKKQIGCSPREYCKSIKKPCARFRLCPSRCAQKMYMYLSEDCRPLC